MEVFQINYIGWISERLPEKHFKDPRQRWEARFIILKGGELCIFESPPVSLTSRQSFFSWSSPTWQMSHQTVHILSIIKLNDFQLNSDDLSRCLSLYKIYDTAFKVIDREKLSLDKREHCFWIETSMNGLKHYMSVESYYQLNQFDVAYHRCLHSTVNSFQVFTFISPNQFPSLSIVISFICSTNIAIITLFLRFFSAYAYLLEINLLRNINHNIIVRHAHLHAAIKDVLVVWWLISSRV